MLAELYRPPFAWWMVVTAIVAIGAASVVLYGWRDRQASWLRRIVMIALRLVALSAIAWIFAGPSVMHSLDWVEQRVPVVILADTSASMDEHDVLRDEKAELPGMSRWEALCTTWLSDAQLARLGNEADVELFAFDDEVQRVSLQGVAALSPTGKETFLFDAVRRTLAEPGDGAVMLVLSDGHDTAVAGDPAVVEQARQSGRPIFAVPVGQVRSTRDIAIQAWPEADFLFEGQSTTIHAALLQRGFAGHAVRIELFHGGRLLHDEDVILTEDATQRFKFRVTPQAHPDQTNTIMDYTVRAALLPALDAEPDDEPFTDNNEQQVFVQVSRQRMKVALFEGQPYWDTRYLARVLDRDPNVEFTAVYRLGLDRTITRGEKIEKLNQAVLNDFDVVILGKRAELFFPGSEANMLVDYVRQRGGALVLARGQPFSAGAREARRMIDVISPVTWGRRVTGALELELTPQGRHSPLTTFENLPQTSAVLSELPDMLAATRIDREKAASVVLLRQSPSEPGTPNMAAVATMTAGRGQVFAVLSDGLWRWALLPSELAKYDSVYQLFWSRAIRWLATGGEFLPGQHVSMQLSRLMAEPDQTVEVTVATRYVESDDFRPRLRVIGPDGDATELTPRREDPRATVYRATLRPTKTGVYRVELDAPNAPDLIGPTTPIVSRLAVYDRAMERLDPAARPDVLKDLTDATGGACLTLDEADTFLERVTAIREARRSDAKPSYDFARWPVLALIVGCLGLEWLLRRRVGLL